MSVRQQAMRPPVAEARRTGGAHSRPTSGCTADRPAARTADDRRPREGSPRGARGRGGPSRGPTPVRIAPRPRRRPPRSASHDRSGRRSPPGRCTGSSGCTSRCCRSSRRGAPRDSHRAAPRRWPTPCAGERVRDDGVVEADRRPLGVGGGRVGDRAGQVRHHLSLLALAADTGGGAGAGGARPSSAASTAPRRPTSPRIPAAASLYTNASYSRTIASAGRSAATTPRRAPRPRSGPRSPRPRAAGSGPRWTSAAAGRSRARTRGSGAAGRPSRAFGSSAGTCRVARPRRCRARSPARRRRAPPSRRRSPRRSARCAKRTSGKSSRARSRARPRSRGRRCARRPGGAASRAAGTSVRVAAAGRPRARALSSTTARAYPLPGRQFETRVV